MSNIYIQEPPTFGKVLLSTSLGEVEIELWSKEAPKACRNFVQLCMEDYYNETIFHRIVKGFIIQGGDPTGTGTGGDSIYGKPFKDEFHQRLKFNRRGLLGMANAGPNDNHSQFFFTLDKAEELNKKHTIFGKVAGTTIFNVLRMVDAEIDDNDRPVDPPRIIHTEILVNPFEDIVPRESVATDKKSATGSKRVSKSKAVKNFALLSFGEEAEVEEAENDAASKDFKPASSHDLLKDPKLSSVPAVDIESLSSKNDAAAAQKQIKEKLKKKGDTLKRQHDLMPGEIEMEAKAKRTKALKEEARQLKRELTKKKSPSPDGPSNSKKPSARETSPMNDLMRQVVQERDEYIKKKDTTIMKKGSKRQDETMALLEGFHSKIMNLPDVEDDTSDADIGDNWMAHKLVAEEDAAKVKDANLRDEDTFNIYDPRNPMNERRREKRTEKKHKHRRL